MGITLDRMVQLCEQFGLKFQADPTRNVILMGMGALNGSIQLVIRVDEESQCVTFAAPFVETLAATEPRLVECLQAYMAINYRLIIGCYEYDPTDGEVRFRLSVPVDGDFTPAQFDRCLNTTVITVDINRPVSAMIRWAGMAPLPAIEAAWKQHQERLAAMHQGETMAV